MSGKCFTDSEPDVTSFPSEKVALCGGGCGRCYEPKGFKHKVNKQVKGPFIFLL